MPIHHTIVSRPSPPMVHPSSHINKQAKRSQSFRVHWLILLVFLAIVGKGQEQIQPQRIVSTSPSITEALFALGLGPRVVGVSNYCEYPPAVLSLPKVGSYLQPDPELIARLRPDLVIVHTLPNQLTNRLAALHIAFAEVDRGALQDTYTEIQQIGHAAGADAKALELVTRLKETNESDSSAVGGRLASRRNFRDRPNAWCSHQLGIVGNDLFHGRIDPHSRRQESHVGTIAIRLSPYFSGNNYAASIPMSSSTWVIWGHRRKSGKRKSNPARLFGMRFLIFRLFAKDRVYSISSTAFVVPGPRVTEAAEELFTILQGHKPQ